MPLLDSIQDAIHKVMPQKKDGGMPLQSSMTGGIGNGHAPFEDNMIVPKTTIVFHASQVFFNFLAMACFASCAAFQAKWKVGPSGLSGFAIFVSVSGIFFSLFMLLTPVIYEKYDKGARLARALKEVRVGFILSTLGLSVSLLISFITTISAFTQAGCKDPDKDPNADKGDDFKNGLDGFCNTKKAGSIFFWFVFVFWAATFTMTFLDWRKGKGNRPRDPPFAHEDIPADYVAQEDEESLYRRPSMKSTYNDDHDDEPAHSPFSDENRYSGVPSLNNNNTAYNSSAAPQLPRPSFDAYGAFSDPAPSGFAPSAGSPTDGGPRISRTMQYADPYAAVRATVAAGQTNAPPAAPAYSSYPSNGYR